MRELNIFVGDIAKATIDANLRPEKQIEELIKYINNLNVGLDYKLYTNSPYIINNLTLFQGYQLKGLQEHCEAKLRHSLRIYTLEGTDQIEGKYYKEMISDDNLLNNYLSKSNDQYSDLLDLEDNIRKDKF